MADFACALKEGMAAAEKASRAREEIDDVFAELDAQVAQVTDGRLSISVEEFQEAKDPFSSSFGAWREVLEGHPSSPRMYSAVVARNPLVKDGPAKELARWVPHRQGYPCRLIWAGQERFCEDRESLEICLSDLMRDPVVAETLATLIRLNQIGNALEMASH